MEKILSEVLADDLPPAHEVLSGEQWPWNQHVLVADDSVVARNQIIHVLDEMGVSHTVATNGREALDALKSWVEAGKNLDSWLALVLSDIDMPQMDGYALTAAIRSDQHLKNLHVVLHPSLNGVFNESMLDRVDANRFIARFRHDELQQLLKDRLNEHALQFDLA